MMWDKFLVMLVAPSVLMASKTHLMDFKDKKGRSMVLTRQQGHAAKNALFTAAIIASYEQRDNYSECYSTEHNIANRLPEKQSCITASYQDKEIGYVIYEKESDTGALQAFLDDSRPDLLIKQLIVKPEYWRNGIGARLLKEACRQSGTQWGRVLLVAGEYNLPAQQFAKAHAFKGCSPFPPYPEGCFKGYAKALEDMKTE